MVLHFWVRNRGPRQTALALNCERLMQLRMRDRVPPPHDLLQDPHGDQGVQTPGSDKSQKEIDIKKEEQNITSLLQDTRSRLQSPSVFVGNTLFLFRLAQPSRKHIYSK